MSAATVAGASSAMRRVIRIDEHSDPDPDEYKQAVERQKVHHVIS